MAEVDSRSLLKRVTHVLRSGAAIALATLVLLGPGYRQVLDGKEERIPRWVMFSGKGLGIYGVHFELVEPSGRRRTVTWSEFDAPHEAGTRIQAARASTLRDITRQADRICRKVGRPAQLFATARLAIKGGNGWAPKGDPSLDLCVPKNRTAFVGEQPQHPGQRILRRRDR